MGGVWGFCPRFPGTPPPPLRIRRMSRQDANAAFARTSFLYGGNADYIEELYARYEANPGSVDAEWQAFFQSLKDDKTEVIRNAQGASWSRPNRPVRARGQEAAALR